MGLEGRTQQGQRTMIEVTCPNTACGGKFFKGTQVGHYKCPHCKK